MAGVDIYDHRNLPDYDEAFISEADISAFTAALAAPSNVPVTALNDWKPINQKIKHSKSRKKARTKDETREGFVYWLLRYPFLFLVLGWIVFLFIIYNITRLYIFLYEQVFSWKGQAGRARSELHHADSYDEWIAAATRLDNQLGHEKWKSIEAYSYYNSKTASRVLEEIRMLRRKLDADRSNPSDQAVQDLKALLESCIKNNFVGVENPHLYSESFIGTKYLVQDLVDEIAGGLQLVLDTDRIGQHDKQDFFRRLELNYGRTALCLSGGATFAYYHFGVIKALLDTKQLPQIITGTSGGALVAALVGTRTDEELEKLLVPALAYKIKACQDSFFVWIKRWYKTGARFDSIEWARQCAWFCHGSTTFREAYKKTGRVLNVSCVPSDPHSPTILNNHITSPDCVIWSAVLASAAVPGIINPIVLMRKNRDGKLSPYSFGNKWKDGSLRTDVPLKALNIQFNVNFSIVSQVNPHINLFFFSPRGSPGNPVTHRKGRGWRGGFLGSSIETSVKLDLQKYLKILKHLELLPRPLGQDWSELWLQRFSGTVTIWPKSILGDYYNILSDPSPQRLARMIKVGERSCWPRIRFISNRLKVERVIHEGLRRSVRWRNGTMSAPSQPQTPDVGENSHKRLGSGSINEYSDHSREDDYYHGQAGLRRQSTLLEEIGRQAAVLWDDGEPPTEEEADHDQIEDEVMTSDDDALLHNMRHDRKYQ